MEEIITAEYIRNGVRKDYLPFFLIESKCFKPILKEMIESFWESINIFAPNIRLSKPFHILLSDSPFCINKDVYEMNISPKGDVIGFVTGDFICFDVLKIAVLPKELQIAVFLEEFTHAYMNVSDEILVKKIVSNIYPKVKVVEGDKYVISH